jgi:hypothetical protein
MIEVNQEWSDENLQNTLAIAQRTLDDLEKMSPELASQYSEVTREQVHIAVDISQQLQARSS